jgi:hypothetical protein
MPKEITYFFHYDGVCSYNFSIIVYSLVPNLDNYKFLNVSLF